MIVVAKLRRHLLAINRINNIYSIERKFFEFLSVSTNVFFFFFFSIDKHRYLCIQIYLSTKRKNYVRNYESSATAKEQVSSPCVPSWPVTRGRSRTMIEVQLYLRRRETKEWKKLFFVTAKCRWPPLKLDNNRSEESTTFWTRISRVTVSLSIYVSFYICFF